MISRLIKFLFRLAFKLVGIPIIVALDIWVAVSYIDYMTDNLDPGYERWNLFVMMDGYAEDVEVPEINMSEIKDTINENTSGIKSDLADKADETLERVKEELEECK